VKTLIFGLILLAANIAAFGQSAAAVDEVYLARDDGNGKAGEAVSTFFTTDIPIYCVVQLDTAEPVTVKMNFVAVAVPGVKPETKVVTTSYTTKQGQSRVNFTGKPYDKWNAGKYKVEVFVEGKFARDVVFEIRPSSGSPDGAASFQSGIRPKTGPKTKPVVRPKRN